MNDFTALKSAMDALVADNAKLRGLVQRFIDAQNGGSDQPTIDALTQEATQAVSDSSATEAAAAAALGDAATPPATDDGSTPSPVDGSDAPQPDPNAPAAQ